MNNKTDHILSHLPHYLQQSEPGGLLRQLVSVLGDRLEQAEQTLVRILKSHHVPTADNDGSAGFTTTDAPRGDLDKLFALYLDALGGTTLLAKVSPLFTSRSLLVGRMAQILTKRNRQAPHQQKLIADLLRVWGKPVWNLLTHYRVENALFFPKEIQPGFLRELRSGQSPLTRSLRVKIEDKFPGLLAKEDIYTKAMQPRLAHALNSAILLDPSLFPQHYDYWKTLPLSPATWQLVETLHAKFLKARREANGEPLSPTVPPISIRSLRALVYDIPRLNRRLLEASYAYDPNHRPWGLQPRVIPSRSRVQAVLIAAFNHALKDPDLYSPERFPNFDPKLLEALRQQAHGNVAMVNRRLLESAFPREIEPNIVPFRERMLGLIQVLRKGASTREGIINIIAANLGIMGEDPAAKAARDRIQIQEFSPKPVRLLNQPIVPGDNFTIINLNPGPETATVRITVADLDGKLDPNSPDFLPRSPKKSDRELRKVTVTDLVTGERVRFHGRLGPGDTLTIKGDTAWKNDETASEHLEGSLPLVPRGRAIWRFDATIYIPPGAYDIATLDQSYFSDPVICPNGEIQDSQFDFARFDESSVSNETPLAQLIVDSQRITPATFTVTVPWHLPGFTDSFEESDGHPRHQIPSLVSRVKAAGVQCTFVYQHVIREVHDLADTFFPQSLGEDQDVNDVFLVHGHYDFCRFDESPFNPYRPPGSEWGQVGFLEETCFDEAQFGPERTNA